MDLSNHAIQFGDVNSYTEWGLILREASFPAPSPKRYTVDIPARNGIQDLTSVLSPYMRYGPRPLSFKFFVLPGGWNEMLSNIMGHVHGKTMEVRYLQDPDYFWRGFCTYDDFASNETTGELVISCEAEPFKYHNQETTYTATGNATLTCVNDRMEVTPTITNTEDATLSFGTLVTTLSAGTHKVPGIQFAEGDNVIEIESAGTTTITYREGRF